MKRLLLIAILCLAAATASAQELAVAAAADLQPVLPEVAARFEKQTGHHIRVQFGSSGQFLLQIENGAPFDLFLSADRSYPEKLLTEGLAEPNSLTMYASGKLALYVPSGSKLELSQGLRSLLAPEVKRIAIANPRHAPYGRAAVESLQHAGIYEAIEPKLVMGENIGQAAQFVQSGNADAGLIALSLVRSPQMMAVGRYVEVSGHSPLDQAAVILKSSKSKPVAAEFLKFLRSAEVVQLLEKSGFAVPGK